MEVTLFSAEQCDIVLDQEIGCVIVDWKAYATSEQFREIHELLFQFICKNNIKLILGNAANLVQISAAEQEWVCRDFYPRLVAAGVRADAVVRSRHYFSQIAIDSIHFHPNKNVIVKYFDNKEDARKWLRDISRQIE